MAVVAGNITGLHILCQYLESAILSVCDHESNTALHFAAGLEGDMMEIMLQATDCRLSLRVQNLYGEIPLHFACACSQLANTQLLLNFDPNSCWNFNPKRLGNAAHICAWHGSIACLLEVLRVFRKQYSALAVRKWVDAIDHCCAHGQRGNLLLCDGQTLQDAGLQFCRV